MRWNGFLILMALAVALCGAATPCAAASFGTVVAIGGQASDIALDESRGLLYIANFTANRIDVMSHADNTIHTSINVAAQPGAGALSRDAQYLLVAHYQQHHRHAVPSGNLLTLIHPERQHPADVSTRAIRRWAWRSSPTRHGGRQSYGRQALIVTTTGFYIIDPQSGVLRCWTPSPTCRRRLPVRDRHVPRADHRDGAGHLGQRAQ